MNALRPAHAVLHENDPLSVASYNVQLRADDGNTVLVESPGHTADPSGDTLIPLGTPDGFLFAHPELIGQTLQVWAQQVGPAGDVASYQQCTDEFGHPSFVVRETANGAEGRTVTY